MEFCSTAAQTQLYEQAREFAGRRVNPAVRARGEAPYFGEQEWRLCGELGLLGSCVPERYGGGGPDALPLAHPVEGFARGRSEAGVVLPPLRPPSAGPVPPRAPARG